MQSRLSSLFFWVFMLIIFSIPFLGEFSYMLEDAQLNPNDYARITDVDYKAVVVDDLFEESKVVITERLTFDIHAASEDNLFWELWRDLPEDNVDGLHVNYRVNSVKQIMDDGTEIYYEESPKLYWDDYDYVSSNPIYGPGKWYHSKGPYDEENEQYECVFFYVDGLYREQVVFEIEYEMYNAALRYNDCSDLYLSMYSESTIKYLDSFKAQILFPDKDMPSSGNYDVFTYGTNSNEFPVTESDTLNPGYHTFSIDLDKEQLQFKPYNQYIEFDLVSYGEDKHIFTENAPDNYYSYDNVLDEIYEEQREYAETPKKYRNIKTVIFLASAIGAILSLIYSLTAGARTKKKHIFYKPTVEMQYFRDIPSDLDPNFAAALVFCKQKPMKDDSGIYSAILLSLARKKYIELTEWENDDVLITINKRPAPTLSPQPVSLADMGVDASTYSQINMAVDSVNATVETIDSSTVIEEKYEPLTICEEYYFNLLIRHASSDKMLMSDFQRRVSSDYEYTDTFARNMQNSIVNTGINYGYFQKVYYDYPKTDMRKKGNTLLIIGILLIILVNIISYQTRLDLAFGAFFILGIGFIISSIILKAQANKYVLLTQFGEDEYAKWRGLYNFLNSETLIHERTIIELPLWEKYLVYATAFGLSDKIIQAISIRCPEAGSSPIINNNYCRSGRIHRSGRSFRSAVRSGTHTARSGGSGFGYGGGGRGGGGGGGGH